MQAEVSKMSLVVAKIFFEERTYAHQFWMFVVIEFSVLSEIFQM